MIRLIVCMDFDTDNLDQAYAELHEVMDSGKLPSFGWETSDEWYHWSFDGQDGHEPGDVIELNRAAARYFHQPNAETLIPQAPPTS